MNIVAARGAGFNDPLPSATPLFSLDHTEFEAALAADHVNVEDTAHKLSRSDVEAAVDAIVSAAIVAAQAVAEPNRTMSPGCHTELHPSRNTRRNSNRGADIKQGRTHRRNRQTRLHAAFQ